MKNFNEWAKSIYWVEWYDYIEDKLEEYRKTQSWKKWTDERINKALQAIAEKENINADELVREYLEQ